MDIQKYLDQVENQISSLKSEMFEVRQLLKYAFKEDIIDEKLIQSSSLIPKKDYVKQNKNFKPRNK